MFKQQESYFEKNSDKDLEELALRLKFKKEKSREKSKGKKKERERENLPSIKVLKEENRVRSGRRHLTNVREPKSIGEIHFRTIETIVSSSEE